MSLKQYLGDSVYADTDGWNVHLTTENGMPGDPSNSIFLEPEILAALFRYVEWIKQQKAQPTEETSSPPNTQTI